MVFATGIHIYSNLKQKVLDKVQNQSQGVVLGTMKSSPIAALKRQSNCRPLENKKIANLFAMLEEQALGHLSSKICIHRKNEK